MTHTLSQSQLANYPWCTSLQPPERTPSSNYKTADQHMQLVIYKNGGMAKSDSGVQAPSKALVVPLSTKLNLIAQKWLVRGTDHSVIFRNQTEVN